MESHEDKSAKMESSRCKTGQEKKEVSNLVYGLIVGLALANQATKTLKKKRRINLYG